MDETGVALVFLIPAAGNGVTHHFFPAGTNTLDLVILTTFPTHDIPLSSRTVFIDHCILCRRGSKQIHGKQ